MNEILIVEDDADIREILLFNLENEGYAVSCAGSAEEWLQKLPPGISLVILYVMLP